MTREIDHAGLGAAYLRSHPEVPIAHGSDADCGYCDTRPAEHQHIGPRGTISCSLLHDEIRESARRAAIAVAVEVIRSGLIESGIGAGASLGVPELIGPRVVAAIAEQESRGE